ncbi:ABC transporter ATP-binding protein [Serratia symbiotica]|nr:ABC transporter ATP-binding protein [Serratia symbiotica]
MITLQQAEIGYGSVPPLFSPLSGHFATGSLTAVVGVNGAGKSTLLKTLAGLQPLQGGSLHFSGNQPPRIAYLPQQTELDRQFPIRVSDLVAIGNWEKSGMFGGLSKYASRHIAEALECVGMTAMASRPVGELSGGQLQRVLFARLLVQQAQLILLDEPFTGIDSATTQLLVQVIEQLYRQGRTLIAVLHDMSLVTNHFSQVLLLTPQCCHWGDADWVLEHIPALNVASQPQYQMAVVS